MTPQQIKSPEGFCRVSELTKNSSEQNYLYKCIEEKKIPHARLGTGHASVVFIHRESAMNMILEREKRRNVAPVIIPVAVKSSEDGTEIKELGKHLNTCLHCIYREQVETNRLLSELLKIWTK